MGCQCNKHTEDDKNKEMDREEEMKNYLEEKNKENTSINIDNKKSMLESSYSIRPYDLINKDKLENQLKSVNENNNQIFKSKKNVLNERNFNDNNYNDNNDNNYNNNNNNNNNYDKITNDDNNNNNYNNNNINYNSNDNLNIDNENINKNNYNSNNNNNENNYKSTVFRILNQVREDPSSFIPVIKDNMQYIIEETIRGGEDFESKKIIFKKKLKVALYKGIPAFNEAIETLKNITPIEPFIYKKELEVPLPKTEEEISDNTYFKRKINEMKEKGINIKIFFKDLIKDGEISALLMIIDDSQQNPGIKRECILNPNFKYIGISHVTIGKKFVAYITFSKD